MPLQAKAAVAVEYFYPFSAAKQDEPSRSLV
jgi:hypothetical protein